MQSTRYFCHILMKLISLDRFPKMFSNTKFYESPSNGGRVVPSIRTDGRTDLTKLTVAFRNFANAPPKTQFLPRSKHA